MNPHAASPSSSKEDLPALAGGVPVRKEYLVFGSPLIEEDEIQAVVETLRSGWISTGPRTDAFAKAFREYIGTEYSVATNSCSAALTLSLIASGVKPGDEVITTPMTFAATVNTIVHRGAIPVFADISPQSFTIDPGEIKRRITARTKAIVVVHYAGIPCAMDEIMAIARHHGIPVIEDAAHAAGSEYRGRKVGTLGDYGCFSFYVTKNLTTAEGGMITTNDKIKAEMMSRYGLHGLDLDAWQRYSHRGFKRYEIVYPGFKFNMTDIAASMGLVQLKKLERFIETRTRYAEMYHKELESLEEVILPKHEIDGRHSWHLYPILVRPEKISITRDEIIEALHWENIGAAVHYRAVHFQKYYRENTPYRRGDFVNAEFVSDRVISLPLSPKMAPEDVMDTVRALRKIIAHYRKKSS